MWLFHSSLCAAAGVTSIAYPPSIILPTILSSITTTLTLSVDCHQTVARNPETKKYTACGQWI